MCPKRYVSLRGKAPLGVENLFHLIEKKLVIDDRDMEEQLRPV